MMRRYWTDLVAFQHEIQREYRKEGLFWAGMNGSFVCFALAGLIWTVKAWWL